MITCKDCYIKDTCYKYTDEHSCTCQTDTYCPKLFRIDQLYNKALLPLEQRRTVRFVLDENKTDKDVYNDLILISNHIEQFVNSGGSIYIYSRKCGNGKTAWASHLLQRYIESIWHKCDITCKALFINVPQLLINLKANIETKSDYITHIKNNIETADLVIWDEVGSKVGTQFELENLLNFINARINMRKANIYTSNLAPQELKECVGERLYSRIINLSVIYNFQGPDMRGR